MHYNFFNPLQQSFAIPFVDSLKVIQQVMYRKYSAQVFK